MGIVESDSGSFAGITKSRHRCPGVSAVFADVGGVNKLRSIEAGCAANNVVRVPWVNGNGGFVASVQAGVTDFNRFGAAVQMQCLNPALKLWACIRNRGSKTGAFSGLVYR